MAILARRTIQDMLNELSKHMSSDKAKDLLNGLNHRNDTKATLAAEAELILLWGISRTAHLEIEPTLSHSGKKPDAASNDLFDSRAAIEITALSDDGLSETPAMERTANIICNFANHVRKLAGRRLAFEFQERRWVDNHKRHRERCVEIDFEISESSKKQLVTWIESGDPPTPKRIELIQGKTDVHIIWRQRPASKPHVYSRMPAVTYDLEKNTLYNALRKKEAQLKGVDKGVLRVVFLFDAGSSLLRWPHQGTMEVSGDQVLQHALEKLDIDVLCVFSPQWEPPGVFEPAPGTYRWAIQVYDSRRLPRATSICNYPALKKLAENLPQVSIDAFQARSMHKHGVLDPKNLGASRHVYLPSNLSWPRGVPVIRISSRMLHDILAGRISSADSWDPHRNPFEKALQHGQVIKGVSFESGGHDTDDDFVIIEFDYDFARQPFFLPKE